jgi:4-amino-4-deoxy-L-arabinose transferase-like glycosyltransferase
MPLAGFALSHFAFAACFAALAAALGRRLAALACPRVDWPREGRWSLPLALGVGTLACLASLLGAAGLLTRVSLVALAAAAALVAAPEWRPLVREVWGEAWAVARGPRRVWVTCALAAALPGLLLALYPPTGFDALLYHLPAAGRFAASGRIALAPELRFPAFPWLNEVLFAAAMRLQDDVAAQLVECVVHLGTAALLWEWGRRRFGARAGALAAALWLGSPLAAWLAASAYVEPLVALFLLAAAAALDLAERADDGRARLLAGGLAGCAAATKYSGLLAVAMVAIWTWRGAPAGRRLRASLPPLAAAAAVALPWYAWIARATGDPLFPVLARMGHAPAGGLDLAARMTAVLALPWRAVVDRGARPYPPGSPLLWALWPLPWLARLGEILEGGLARRLAGIALAIGLAIAVSNADARLVSVAGPLAALAIAAVVAPWAAARWGEAGAAPRLLALALVAVLPGWLYTARLAARRGPIPADAAARESFLRRQLPGYGALSWLNAAAGRRATVYGMWAEELRYYAAGNYLGDWFGPARFADALALAGRPAELHAFLAGLGVDHLLIRRMPWQRGPSPFDSARLAPFFRLEYRDSEAVVLELERRPPVLATGGPEGLRPAVPRR